VLLITSFILGLLYVLIAYHAFRRNELVQVLPSFAWLAFMVTPFLFSFKYFDQESVSYQLFGIAFIALAFMFGDLLCVNKQDKGHDTQYLNFKISNKFLMTISFIVVIVPLLHLFLTGNSPLFDLLFGNFTKNEISNERELYSKFQVPYIFSIITNLTINIIMPMLLVIQFYLKRYYLFVTTLIYGSIYALNSTAKLPFISLIFALVITMGLTTTVKYKKIVGLISIFCFGLTILFGVWYGNIALKNKETCPVPTNVNSSPANISRSCPENVTFGVNPIVNTIGYRVFLTPVEVSNHWYEFFLADQNSFRGVSSLLERDTYKKTANEIGIQYYTIPFPDSYGSSISAYSSIDADAFSFGGLLIVAVISLLLFAIRIYIGLSKSNSPPLTKVFEALALNMMIILPFSASIQAILLPQGLALLLVSIFYLRNFKKVS
jgi:hypothetical protein